MLILPHGTMFKIVNVRFVAGLKKMEMIWSFVIVQSVREHTNTVRIIYILISMLLQNIPMRNNNAIAETLLPKRWHKFRDAKCALRTFLHDGAFGCAHGGLL